MISRQLTAFLDKYVHMQGMPPNLKTSQVTKLTMQKLTDIHLTSHLDDEIEEKNKQQQLIFYKRY